MASHADLAAALAAVPLVPVLTVPDAETAVPLALALQAGGLQVLEVTLRTPAALDVIRHMKAATPNLLVGAGTVLGIDDVQRATAAGADFLVTPGTTPSLSAALRDAEVPAVPGVATMSEALQRREEGFELLKLFPAAVVGGAALLKAIGAPVPDLRFIPTGGIAERSMADYLALPNVAAVGGSWFVTQADLEAGAWEQIEARTRAAVAAATTRDAR